MLRAHPCVFVYFIDKIIVVLFEFRIMFVFGTCLVTTELVNIFTVKR